VGWPDQQNVDHAADLVDGQRDQVRLSMMVWGSGVGGADREDGEGGQGKGGEPVPGRPTADLVLVKPDLALPRRSLRSSPRSRVLLL
jgi:hypothetical protein